MQVMPIVRSFKQLQLDWKNLLVHVHDNLCACDSPIEHTIHNLTENPKELRLSTATKKQLQQCLTTTDAHIKKDVIDGFADGELDALFAQDTEEDTG